MELLQHQAEGYPSELQIPCTKSRDVRCQLLEHRTAINKVLLDIGLEIREDHLVAGGVRMAATQTPVRINFFCWKPKEWLERSSTSLVYDLIANHRCFSALEVYSNIPWPKHVRRALKRCSAVKSLCVHLVRSSPSRTPVPQDIKYSDYKLVKGQLPDHTLRHLTTLDLSKVHLSIYKVDAFFWALAGNQSVTDFAVNWRFLRLGLTSRAKLGSVHLPRRLAVLRKLALTDSGVCCDRDLWLRLTQAFAEKATLEELYVEMKMEVEIYPAVSEGFAEVVRRCTKLRCLQLPAPSRRRYSLLPEYDDNRWSESLINALKETRELRDLYISIAGMGETLLRTSVFEVPPGENRAELSLCTQSILECCKILCRRGARVTFEVSCRAASGPTRGNWLTWLTWLAESSALTHVTVVAFSDMCISCADVCDQVVSALAKNSSIVKLGLVQFQLEAAHLEALCRNAREHRSLTEVVLTPTYTTLDECCIPYFNRISEDFCAAALQLRDVVRQNASWMNAAVKYVLGDISADGASAVDELLVHPRLVERVRDEGRVTDAKAREMVKLAVSRVRNMDVHDFLWLTGVVNQGQASRLDHDSQELHILDLPTDCWLHLRQFLKINDVVSC
ncbi:hypothetical protein MTO96_037377 [Rhipicephalus appendiculatus]